MKILFLILFFITFNSLANETKDCYDCHKILKKKFQKYIHKPVADKRCTDCHRNRGSENKLMLDGSKLLIETKVGGKLCS
ncbi:MAG: cytochrome c3 family protein, partial [bacterium]